MELIQFGALRDSIKLIGGFYIDQSTVFSKFYEHVSSLNGEDAQRVYPGIVVESPINRDYFDIQFVGRRFRFSFQISWSHQEGPATKLSCCEIFPTELKISPKSIYQISINPSGVTESLSIDPPGNIYRADCTNIKDALWLTFQGIFSGLIEAT